MMPSSGEVDSQANFRAIQPDNVGVVVIHGVGDAELGWINDHIVKKLSEHHPELAFEGHSEVYRLEDGEGRRRAPSAEVAGEERHFKSVVRRARLGDRATVSFAELNWADISRVGYGTLSQTLDILKLYFEAPHTVGANFLRQRATGIHAVIRWLVLGALWVLRWPIAGMQFSIFGAAFGYLGIVYLGTAFKLGAPNPDYLPQIVVALLLVVAYLGLRFSRWRAKDNIGLTSLGLATTICSLVLAIVVVAFATFATASSLETVAAAFGVEYSKTLASMQASDSRVPATYLAIGGWLIIATWFVWNVLILTAIALILLVALSRLLFGSAKVPFPLRRPAAAAALAVLQGVVWKLVICPASVLLIDMLVPSAERAPNMWAISGYFGVDDIRTRMFMIAGSNALISIIVACVVYGICRRRSLPANSWNPDGTTLPRLIVHPAIVFSIMSLQVATIVFYYLFMTTGSEFFQIFKVFLERTSFDFAVIATPIITVLPHVFGMVTETARPVLHVARDIVDHQYRRRLNVALVRNLLPREVRYDAGYPRRRRIQTRLLRLMDTVVQPQRFDRLVFLTHSQGTVILYDYLRSDAGKSVVSQVGRVDIITLASPLSHLYQYYFPEYEQIAPNAAAFSDRIATWTNMWRVDDPIGDHVAVIADGFIENRQLGPGGHVNYWKEPEVCAAILRVIDPALLPEPNVAGRVRAEAHGSLERKRQDREVPPLFPLLHAAS